MSDSLVPKRDVEKTATLGRLVKIAALGLCLFSSASFAQQAAEATLDEQVMIIPARSGNIMIEMETTVFKPPGTGPFPLVVMNHGKDPGDPQYQKRDRFLVLSREFVKRGYAVVVPMRRGFSKSTGTYLEDGCNMTHNGQLQANDLVGSLEYFRQQPWVDKDRIIVAGQSYGGLATMAFGTRNFPGVKGLINFSGGLRADGGTCQWQGELVTAFAEYGGKSTLPSLWFYGQNDSYFNHELANRLHNAYLTSGGNAKLVAYPAFKRDAHGMVGSRDGVKIWWPETEHFLRQIGMPTEKVVTFAEKRPLPKTDFAAIDNVDAIPFLKDTGREAYRIFLSKSLPRAFALSASGEWSWAEEGDDPAERVLTSCQASSGAPCKLYAVDDYVVWSANPVNLPSGNISAGK
ncbi:MAG: dienelactone hydrolase [Burkholderiales bacterium RIFCSPLOWO2_02_FULL_57_36]|nr:MAG: dienelactone hydrolase [Burkholderiales bacterium RIFCSPLOWO2_02_FULL_57_36]